MLHDRSTSSIKKRSYLGISTSILAFSLLAVLVATNGGMGCGGSLGGECIQDSDCEGSLICIYQFCHAECTATKDCDTNAGEMCFKYEENHEVRGYCDMPSECMTSENCTEMLNGQVVYTGVCREGMCRDQCGKDSDCTVNQACFNHVCYETCTEESSTSSSSFSSTSSTSSSSSSSSASSSGCLIEEDKCSNGICARVAPALELGSPCVVPLCEGADENCEADDGSSVGASCSVGEGACLSTGVVICDAQSATTKCGASPGAPSLEVCDNIDNDCDGVIDQGLSTACYTGPADTYGVGVCHGGTSECSAGVWGACVGEVVPTLEACNNIDDDCDGSVDNGASQVFCKDEDHDSYGNPGMKTVACAQPIDYVANCTDCNDSNANIKPGGIEVCNGFDDDCDSSIDEGVTTTFFKDNDADGFGNAGAAIQACSQPPGYVANSTDCNDAKATIKPGATETCNGFDDDCDGSVDEGVKTTFCKDNDADGFGNSGITTQACSQPAGYVLNCTDCNDSVSSIKPGGVESCNNIDDDCDGMKDEGNPGGGQACNTGVPGVCAAGTTACTGGSIVCNQNTQPSPGPDHCADMLDTNCDGSTNEDCVCQPGEEIWCGQVCTMYCVIGVDGISIDPTPGVDETCDAAIQSCPLINPAPCCGPWVDVYATCAPDGMSFLGTVCTEFPGCCPV